MKKKILSEDEIFEKFHKYTYRDVEVLDKEIHELVVNAVYDSTCCAILATQGSFNYLASLIEYITYNSQPIKVKHVLRSLLTSGEVKDDCIVLDVHFCKKSELVYCRRYIVYIKEEVLLEVGKITLKNKDKLIDLT